MRRLFLFFFIISTSTATNAQPQFSGWLASFNTFRINNKLSLHFDAQLRSTDEIKSVQSILLRPGLNVHISKSWVLTVGYAYIANRRTVGDITNLLPEHRIWQQALFNHKINRIAVAHRFRFEERFISKAVVEDNELETDGFNQALRFRYFIRSIVPLVNQSSFVKGPFFAVQNEVFLNTGNKTTVNGKTFDQNRLYGALGYRLQGKLDIEAGYMNQYTSTAASFINNHIVQIALYKRL